MFSQLGPLFKTVFRAAEHADARLEIRREEKEDGRKKREDGEKEDDSTALWEDSTSVSIPALRTFLIEFLKKQGADDLPAAASPDGEISPAALQDQAPPVSTVAARAVKAYTSMASQNSYTPPVTKTPPQETTDLADLLESDEIRTIHRLIGELDTLAKAGVDTLTIEMNGTFLDSVSEAVRLQKETL